MRFETPRRRHRREVLERGWRPEWRRAADRSTPHLALLDPDERRRLDAIALGLVAGKRWEAANGFELTDEIVAVIASQAALLVLELAPDAYRNVGAVIVHPTTVVLRGERSVAPGLRTDEPMPIAGQAAHDGPVLIVWDSVLAAARHPERGHNVVFHEFAHKLDMLSGTSDGTPPLATRAELDQWVEVCTAAYGRVVAGGSSEAGGPPVLRPYAGVNPAEFFAVATEAFFDVPVALAAGEPSLYGVLRRFYRQDPGARAARAHPTGG